MSSGRFLCLQKGGGRRGRERGQFQAAFRRLESLDAPSKHFRCGAWNLGMGGKGPEEELNHSWWLTGLWGSALGLSALQLASLSIGSSGLAALTFAYINTSIHACIKQSQTIPYHTRACVTVAHLCAFGQCRAALDGLTERFLNRHTWQ